MTDRDGDASTVVIRLEGELDAADDSWVAEIEQALDAGSRRIVLDLLNVSFVDSSVVRQLLLLHRRVADGGLLRLAYTHHLIGRVIGIVGLDDLFPQYATVQAALRGSPSRAGRESAGRVPSHDEPGHTVGEHAPDPGEKS